MRLRLVLAAGIGVLAMATPALATVPATDCHGVAFSDAANDQYIGSPLNTFVRPTKAIDVRDVYFTGSGITERVNIQVGELTAWNNTSYTFRWDDDAVDNLGGYYELTADFLGANGTADVTGQGLLTRHDVNGSTLYLNGHAFQAAYHGAAGEPGVIQLGLPAEDGPAGFPSTITGMGVDSVQYESNVLTLGVRQDTATAPSAWTQPC